MQSKRVLCLEGLLVFLLWVEVIGTHPKRLRRLRFVNEIIFIGFLATIAGLDGSQNFCFAHYLFNLAALFSLVLQQMYCLLD